MLTTILQGKMTSAEGKRKKRGSLCLTGMTVQSRDSSHAHLYLFWNILVPYFFKTVSQMIHDLIFLCCLIKWVDWTDWRVCSLEENLLSAPPESENHVSLICPLWLPDMYPRVWSAPRNSSHFSFTHRLIFLAPQMMYSLEFNYSLSFL